jgi:hypothetical protein
MADINVHIDLDQSGVFSMVETFTTQLADAEFFAAKEIERVLKEELFEIVVRRLGARAGPGWSKVYTDHLVHAMKAYVPFVVNRSGAIVEVGFTLDNLGDYSDLERGAHMKAIESQEWIPHPSQIQLPYEGQPLANEQERRQEFWEAVVIGRDMSFPVGPNGQRTAADLGYIATYDEVALARVLDAWLYKAPEWLWLENGFNESKPEIYPVDFVRTLELITSCVASKIYEAAIEALQIAAQSAGQAVGVGIGGRPFAKRGGQFVAYKEQLNLAVGDYSGCIGGI